MRRHAGDVMAPHGRRRLCATLALALMAAAGGAAADPQLWTRQGWTRTDFSTSAVDFAEILSGGPPKDGIPAIDDPTFVAVPDIRDLAATEPVISVAIGGKARAYPLRVLIWHEIVNDTLAGRPITVTYCPLCNSAIVFDRRVGDRMLDFGTTGKLRNSDLVMYDRQTESWWQQFTGEAIVGTLTGARLSSIPSRLESFELFAERHPGGQVLVPSNPEARPYGRTPYGGYDGRSEPYPLYQGGLPTDIDPMARVVVFESAGGRQAVALKLLAERGSLEIDDVVLAWRAGQSSVLDTTDVASGRDVGNVTARRVTATEAEDIVYDITFAFVVHAFHPDLAIRQN